MSERNRRSFNSVEEADEWDWEKGFEEHRIRFENWCRSEWIKVVRRR